MVGRQLLQPLLFSVQNPNAVWSVHFMAGENIKIGIQRLYIDRHVHLRANGRSPEIESNDITDTIIVYVSYVFYKSNYYRMKKILLSVVLGMPTWMISI